jgi:O-antigen ligase
MLILFYIILLALPLNLGKHFIFDFSYSEGALIDYALPTVYVQDLLILLFLVLHVVLCRTLPKKSIYLLPLILLLLLNILTSANIFASVYFASRLVIYSFFALISTKYLKKISGKALILLLVISISSISLLALTQWVLQHSLFNNYIFFGEQPYFFLTPGILHHTFLGDSVIPPYAIFKHPNVLGGYLSIALVSLVLLLISYTKVISTGLSLFLFISVLLGTLIVFLTFSYSAWLSFFLGICFVYLSNYNRRIAMVIMPLVVTFVFILGMFGFFSASLGISSNSLSRRLVLIQSSAHLFTSSPYFGTGLNTNAFLIKDTPFFVREVNFFQPVHNIYWLLLSEGGLVLFIPFIILVLYSYLKSLKINIFVSVTLSQFLLLGVFDHYLLTSHQMLLLVLLTLAASLNYTFKHEI